MHLNYSFVKRTEHDEHKGHTEKPSNQLLYSKLQLWHTIQISNGSPQINILLLHVPMWV